MMAFLDGPRALFEMLLHALLAFERLLAYTKHPGWTLHDIKIIT